jgi:MobA/MobL family
MSEVHGSKFCVSAANRPPASLLTLLLRKELPMETRPLLTCHHSAIGTKKHKARTATEHMAYILRSAALTKFVSEHLPEQGQGTTSYFDNLAKEAIEAGRDVRICDKIILALPKELSFEQQLELVQSFMQQLGQGRIAWGAALHTKGKDVNNPHAHIIFKDSDIETGKRVLGTTTSAKEVREAEEHGWKVPPRLTSNGIRFAYEKHLNSFMEKLGIDIRFDARSYAERGINQIPQMHFGFRAKKLDEMGYGFEGNDAEVGNRFVVYSLIDDAGRLDHNQAIRDTNRELAGERAKSSGQIQADRLEQKRTERGAGKELTDAKQSTQHSARDPLPQLPLSRGQQETADLKSMQKKALKRLLEEHRLDNAALRKVQDTEKAEHRLWANALYKASRASAFIGMKERMEPEWRKLNGMPRGDQRDKAGAVLRSDTEKKWRSISGLPRGEERRQANATLAAESKQR